MDVTIVPIGSIVPYEGNPRKNSSAVAKVAASLREFGWRQPIVVDRDGVVVAGHTRLLAAQSIGMLEVPVHVATGLTPEQVRAYRLADNRTADEAEWDDDLLKIELGDLDLAGYDLRLTGFDDSELARIRLIGAAGVTDPDDAPEPPLTPTTQLGDVWLLGRHRLACGDATDAATVTLALAGCRPHLMVTDPPYGVAYDAAWRDERAKTAPTMGNRKDTAKGRVENDDRADWREAWSLFPGDVAYIWHAHLQAPAVAASLVAAGFELRQAVIWNKGRIVVGRAHYQWQHEPAWYAVRRGATGHWRGDRKQSTVWDIPMSRKSETGHSTQKPVDCMRRPIENNSAAGEGVYDPFCGSGTTIIAAEITGRACHAIELSPAYVDVAVKRWQDYSGGIVTLAATGQTFETLTRVRLKDAPAPIDEPSGPSPAPLALAVRSNDTGMTHA